MSSGSRRTDTDRAEQQADVDRASSPGSPDHEHIGVCASFANCCWRFGTGMNMRPIFLALILIGPPAYAKDVIVEVKGRPVRLDISSPVRPNATDPTIVFESGLGTPGTSDFVQVLPLLKGLRTVRYARPGIGGSADDAESPTPRHIATVLHDALSAAGVTPPYVLVGHSLGGTRIRMFAGIYPNEVAGLVFVDPTPDF